MQIIETKLSEPRDRYPWKQILKQNWEFSGCNKQSFKLGDP